MKGEFKKRLAEHPVITNHLTTLIRVFNAGGPSGGLQVASNLQKAIFQIVDEFQKEFEECCSMQDFQILKKKWFGNVKCEEVRCHV